MTRGKGVFMGHCIVCDIFHKDLTQLYIYIIVKEACVGDSIGPSIHGVNNPTVPITLY